MLFLISQYDLTMSASDSLFLIGQYDLTMSASDMLFLIGQYGLTMSASDSLFLIAQCSKYEFFMYYVQVCTNTNESCSALKLCFILKFSYLLSDDIHLIIY